MSIIQSHQFNYQDLMDFRKLDEYLHADHLVVRTCANVLDNNGEITDELRLEAGLPLLRELISTNKRALVLAHIGRPKGKVVPELSMKPIVEWWQEHLDVKLELLQDLKELADWQKQNKIDHSETDSKLTRIAVLENVRFFRGESGDEAEQAEFVTALAKNADLFINDAFPDYKSAASITGLTNELPSILGPAMLDEVQAISKAISNPQKPVVALMGGAKISDKLDILTAILPKVDKVLIGGAMAYTLLKAQGVSIGKSRVENEFLEEASQLLEKFSEKIVLPTDHLVLSEFKEPDLAEKAEYIKSVEVPAEKLAVDIGAITISRFKAELLEAETIIWNGPMGVFEWEQTETGTRELAAIIAQSEAFSLVGGGDSLAAIAKFGISGYSHVSTGGGALLYFLANETTPALKAIFARD